jgi:hypothetical protein
LPAPDPQPKKNQALAFLIPAGPFCRSATAFAPRAEPCLRGKPWWLSGKLHRENPDRVQVSPGKNKYNNYFK